MKTVNIIEVAPRDGLQNEKVILPFEEKLRFIRNLIEAGCHHIEIGAFVKGSAVPQMAGSADLFRELLPEVNEHIRLSALIPNLCGLEEALKCGVRSIGLLTACSEQFCQRNLNTSIDGSFRRVSEILKNCPAGVLSRLYISMSFYSPWEGRIAESIFYKLVKFAFESGVDEIVLSDTTGQATPQFVEKRLAQCGEFASLKKIACHFHDTYGMATANVWQAWNSGVRSFDSSAGGLGGCPYSPRATGNVATEKLIYLFENSGIMSGIDRDEIITAASAVKTLF
ncbi:MAG: hydroxymethylglutaryl-CoA lyase [Lentisphaeraceae bacterium]|nr:hydroxymethylglutaryl-CoA lyase [Lentisphaeraceae bacterium]